MSAIGGVHFRPPSSMLSILEEDKSATPPQTHLACTLGPESRSVDILRELLEAGMAIARFDFSYGTKEFHQETLEHLKVAQKSSNKLCALCLDTQGPEIYVINRPEQPIMLEEGQTLRVTTDRSVSSSSSVLAISLPSLQGCNIQAGSQVFVGQYLFTGSESSSAYLTIQEVNGNELTCFVNNTCVLEGLTHTVHFARITGTQPILTDQDMDNIRTWGVANQIDFVSLSFVRSAADVQACRDVLNSCGLASTKIISKIECMEGLVNYKEILECSDAIIFSRGNLGVCLTAEKVFMAQKMLLKACNMAGIPVFVTRVVDTMTDAPRPTRAEATDVANLVLDGADGILLGSETFRGRYPVSAAKTVLAICRQAENSFDSYSYYRTMMDVLGANSLDCNVSKADALASSAVRAASKMDAALIIVFTVTGRTARLLAKYRPAQPILTVVCSNPTMAEAHDRATDEVSVSSTHVANLSGNPQARQCLVFRGVRPITADESSFKSPAEVLEYAISYAKEQGLVRPGDRVVVSQCPKVTDNPTMAEAGIVKLITVPEGSLFSASKLPHIGSSDALTE